MRFLCCLLMLLFVLSCQKDPSSSSEDRHPQRVLSGVFVLNEGNFGQLNASLSFYDPESDRIYNHVFKAANNRDLGSIAQSIVFLDSIAIVVVNGSDKLEVINTHTFKAIHTVALPAGSSPRHIAVLNKDKAYVTQLYSNNCAVINLNNWQIIKQIAVGANPEGAAIANDNLYVANSGFGNGNTVSVIATHSDEVIQTIMVADNPISVKALQDKVYILCSGSYGADLMNPEDDTPGGLFCIDAQSNAILDSKGISSHPSKLTLAENGIGYFIGSTGVVQIDCMAMQIIEDAFITGFYYGLDYDPVSQKLYILDAKDFVQNGQLLIYDCKGIKLSEHTVGIIPGNVGFYYE
jgi:YVTN family beta-propeller protein